MSNYCFLNVLTLAICGSELTSQQGLKALTNTAALSSSSDICAELRSIQERVNTDRSVVAALEHGHLLGLEEASLKILESADNLKDAHFVL